jgi:hypothetical protein
MQHVRRHSELAQAWNSNADAAAAFARAGVELGPRCAIRHQARGEPIPLDWSHFLWAMYQARCNLFHGEKNPHQWGDQRVISTGFKVLINAMSRWPDFQELSAQGSRP